MKAQKTSGSLHQQHRLKELWRAQKRIGQSPEKCLDWVVRFCKRELDQLSAGDWENLIFEVVWFSIWGPPIPGAVPSGDDLQISIMYPDNPLPTQEIILKLQEWANTRLAEFIEVWETSIALAPASILVVKRDRRTSQAEMTLKTIDLHQGFAFSFAQTLRVAGARLNQCPECQNYYSARSNQTYCSPRCQNRVSLAKFREAQQTKKITKRKTKPSKRG